MIATDTRSKYLIETDQLAQKIEAGEQVKILDASFFLPNSGKNGADEFVARRIENAVFFDISKISDPNSDLPHTMPSVEVFTEHMKRLNIQRTHQIVCYDQSPFGIFSVGRAAWMLNFFGATNVRILNGGLKKWQAEERKIVSGPVEAAPAEDASGDYNFSVADQSRLISDIGVMHELAGKMYHAEGPAAIDFQVIDARPAERFEGATPEPRPGMRAGHIKNSLNMPFGQLVNADGTLKSDEELAALLESKGVVIGKDSVVTCGSGVTACVVDLALKVLGNKEARLYDGSWSEYGKIDEPKFD